jgi:hypothetical protein
MKIFFSANQKATSSKRGTYVGHYVKYISVNLQLFSIIYTAKKIKSSPLPTQLLRGKIMKWLETVHTSGHEPCTNAEIFIGMALQFFPCKWNNLENFRGTEVPSFLALTELFFPLEKRNDEWIFKIRFLG